MELAWSPWISWRPRTPQRQASKPSFHETSRERNTRLLLFLKSRTPNLPRPLRLRSRERIPLPLESLKLLPCPPLSPQIGGTHSPAPSLPKTVGTSPPPASPSAQAGGMTPSQKENPISLQLKAVETTWLSVKVDAEAEREMMLRPGESIPLEGSNQIYLLIGNAGGLDLIHNGKLLERFGKSGDVVALTFTRQGLDVKRIEKSKPN